MAKSTALWHAHKLGHHHIQNYKKTTAVFGKKFPSFFSRKQWGFCSRELSIIKQHFDELLLQMVNLWLSSELKYGKARDLFKVRGPLLRFHTFFSAHTTDNTLKSSWTSSDEKTVGFFGQGFAPFLNACVDWYRHYHPSTVEFSPEYRLQSKVQGAFLLSN